MLITQSEWCRCPRWENGFYLFKLFSWLCCFFLHLLLFLPYTVQLQHSEYSDTAHAGLFWCFQLGTRSLTWTTGSLTCGVCDLFVCDNVYMHRGLQFIVLSEGLLFSVSVYGMRRWQIGENKISAASEKKQCLLNFGVCLVTCSRGWVQHCGMTLHLLKCLGVF